MRNLLSAALIALLSGCGTMHFTDFKTAASFDGHYNLLSKHLRVTMPDGNRLDGRLVVYHSGNAAFTAATSTASVGANTVTTTGTGVGVGMGLSGSVYCLATGKNCPLLLEIVAGYDELSLHGNGRARTNDGREFLVNF